MGMSDFTRKVTVGESLEWANLIGADLREVMYSNNTKFPEDLKPERYGMVLEE
jgi:hypothetical protein